MGRLAPRTRAAAGLALLGLVVAVYLTLYQAKAFDSIWDPFSLGGSGWILRRSPLVRWLGFPDAMIGAAAYGAELVLELARARSRATPRWHQIALGGALAAMAAGSLGLVVLQALFQHWCGLCLVSAALSVGIAGLLVPEIRGAVEFVARRSTDAPGTGPGLRPPGTAGGLDRSPVP